MGEELKPTTTKMPELKGLFAHVGKTYKDAMRMLIVFKDENKDRIVRENKTDDMRVIFTTDKELHCFMSEGKYEWWCVGRDYIMDGKKMHGGIEVQ